MSEAIHHLDGEVDAREHAQAHAGASAEAFCRHVAGLGHDLKNPLNAILGYTEILIEEFEEVGANDKVADLRKILKSGGQLLSMIEALVGDAREITGKSPR